MSRLFNSLIYSSPHFNEYQGCSVNYCDTTAGFLVGVKTRHTQTHSHKKSYTMDRLKTPNQPTLHVSGLWKPEYPEGTHQAWAGTCKSHAYEVRARFEPQTLET